MTTVDARTYGTVDTADNFSYTGPSIRSFAGQGVSKMTKQGIVVEEETVTFQRKSDLQKDDCIRPGCRNASVMVAKRGVAEIRCCQEEKCMAFAAKLARENGQVW